MLRLILRNQAIAALKAGFKNGPGGQQQHIHYAHPDHDRAHVTEHTEQVLRDIMTSAGIGDIWITSTVRDARDQAHAMLSNLKAEHKLDRAYDAETDTAKRAAIKAQIKKQHVGYAQPGRKVLAAANEALTEGDEDEAVIEKMIQTIRKVGLSSVTKHAATSGRNTVDISASRIRKSFGKAGHDRFINAVKSAVAAGKVARFGWPGGPAGKGKLFQDGACFHLEVEQPK